MLDFLAARQAVTRRLDDLYAGGREHPIVLPYGFDTGKAWAPMIDWDGIMGVYAYLVNKQTGDLTPVSFPEFDLMPEPTPVGIWPPDDLP